MRRQTSFKDEGKGKFTEMGMESGTALTDDGAIQGSMGVAIGDYQHNGRPGIFIANFADQYDTLYRNDGDWIFRGMCASRCAMVSMPWVKWGTAFFDADNDGWLDLAAVSGHPDIVEVRPRHTHPVKTIGIIHASRFFHVGESSIAVVME